jgi:5-methylcytosine-specific restriction enzyme A
MPFHTTENFSAARRVNGHLSEEACRPWFKSPIWKAIKRHRLVQEPNCRRCAQEGYSVTATHVDHVEPHQGQWSRFMEHANTQSLRSRHHQAQRRGHVRQLL